MNDRLLGGLYGALIGDAVGVPYEFRRATDIPEFDKIDMFPPPGWEKTYAEVPFGTWSDDGSLLLCLLEASLEHNPLDGPAWVRAFVGNMQAWRYHGYFAVDGKKFDIGNQTAMALSELSDVNIDPLCRTDEATSNGNGGLMRALGIVLPLIQHTSEDVVFAYAAVQSIPTHAHEVSRVACGVYGLIAWHVYRGATIDAAITKSFEWTEAHLQEDNMRRAFKLLRDAEHEEHNGSGYVVDTFWSALQSIWSTDTYRNAIRRAISFGNDTDTTACVAGGLAGLIYGIDGIPMEWRVGLRGSSIATSVAERLLEVTNR